MRWYDLFIDGALQFCVVFLAVLLAVGLVRSDRWQRPVVPDLPCKCGLACPCGDDMERN